jgi:Glycosyltransferase family 87
MGRRAFAAIHRASTVAVFAALPAVLVVAVVTASFVRGPFLFDFHGGLYAAGKDVVHGKNPYRPSYLRHDAEQKRAGKAVETVIDVPVYPAPPLVAAVPFSLLPYRVAGVLFALLSGCALVLGLRLLGVRDWRCYGVAAMSWPVLHGLMLGALTPLLVLAVGAAWHYRRNTWKTGVAVSAAIVAKLFLWPLAVWLLITRRIRAFVVTVVVGLLSTFLAWAAIGFAGLADYPRMLGDLSYVSEDVGASPVAALIALGLSAAAAKTAAILLGAGLLVYAWRVARGPAGDRRAFGLAVLAALVASPMVWPHYYALVFVPIALVAPRLSPLWFVPLLVDIRPLAQTTGRPWIIGLYLLVAALVAWTVSAPDGPDVTGFRAARWPMRSTSP